MEHMESFHHILGQMNGVYHEIAQRLGLPDSSFEILYILAEKGEGIYQSVLYQESGLGKSTINSAIRKMKQQELLYLRKGEGRNTCVFLTDKGRSLMTGSVMPVVRLENEMIEDWPEEERQMLLSLNQRYLQALLEGAKQIRPAAESAEEHSGTAPMGEEVSFESEENSSEDGELSSEEETAPDTEDAEDEKETIVPLKYKAAFYL